MQQQSDGWLRKPIQISDDGKALDEQGELLNLAFRFPAHQGIRIELVVTSATP